MRWLFWRRDQREQMKEVDERLEQIARDDERIERLNMRMERIAREDSLAPAIMRALKPR